MRLSTLALLAFICTASAGFAQTETFDVFILTPPAGYERVLGKEALQFTRYGDDKSSYCRFTIYATRSSTDNFKDEFLKEWELLVKSVHKVNAPTEIETGPSDDGWIGMSGVAPVQSDNGNYIIMLISIIGHKRAGSILIQTNSDTFNQDITTLAESVEPQKKLVATLYPVTQDPIKTGTLGGGVNAAPSMSTTPVSGNELVGIWSGFKLGSSFYETSSKMKYVAFFEDGSFWNAVGSDGLSNYEKKRDSYPGPWGKYTKEKNSEIGTIRYGALEEIFQLKNGILAYDRVEFKKLPRTDHLKIDGTFTAEQDPKAYNGPEPTITLSMNGRFDDHGAIYWVRHVKGYTEDMQDKMTGSGTYDIYNYTITFKYDDGRLINMTILDTGSPDKAKPTSIRLGNSALCYRK